MLLSAYENEEAEIWRKGGDDTPHGDNWFKSFHSSSFPGDDKSACGRALVYGLMNPAPEKPLESKVRLLFDLGTSIEHMFVKRWSNYGVLLSADVTGEDDYQTGFEDPDCWLTGSPDAILLPPFYTKSTVCDIKTTSHEKVLNMRSDPTQLIYSHNKYVRQLQAYIAEANQKFSPTVITCEKSGLLIKNGKEKCAQRHSGNCIPKILKVEPPDDGTLLYSSREEPLLTASYYITLDTDVIKAGKERLKELKQNFIDDILPEHVHEGESSKWSVGQCKYCLNPDSLVLTTDLEWVEAEKIKVGQEIIGFDEEFISRQKRSRYRPSIVESSDIIYKPRIKISTELGYAIVSEEHQFLKRNYKKMREWKRAQFLSVGDEIVALGKPWVAEKTYDAGYLAGIFDGEGSVTRNFVSAAQVEGKVLGTMIELLYYYGYNISLEAIHRDSKNICYRVRINGGLAEQLRFVGSIRPERLLQNSKSLWDGRGTWSQKSGRVKITAIEELPIGPVIAIATSTRTLISDGLLSHNCDHKTSGYCKQDFKEKIKKLSESNLIAHNKKLRKDYDYDQTRLEVIKRWS